MSARRKPRRPAPRRQQFTTLAAYLRGTETTQRAFARRLRVSQAFISRVASGEQVPEAALAIRIARAANIPLDSFTREKVKRGRAA